jgi:hypothetical protein
VLCGYVASAAAQFGNATPTSPTTPIPLPDPVRAVTPDVERRGGAGPSTQSYVSPVTRRVPPPSPGLQSPSRDVVVAGHRIIYHDPLLTVYPAEGKEALCANGRHLVIILNHHLTSVYSLVGLAPCSGCRAPRYEGVQIGLVRTGLDDSQNAALGARWYDVNVADEIHRAQAIFRSSLTFSRLQRDCC